MNHLCSAPIFQGAVEILLPYAVGKKLIWAEFGPGRTLKEIIPGDFTRVEIEKEEIIITLSNEGVTIVSGRNFLVRGAKEELKAVIDSIDLFCTNN